MTKMSRNSFFVFCILHAVIFVHGTGLYSIVGPGTIRSHFKYNVAVSVHKADGPSEIQVGITGPSYNETKTVSVQPMSTENVKFDVPKLKDGDYNLTAIGVSGLTFKNSTKLNYADYKPSTYIQTDKATYKPGDLVQFRVLFLDENTRPAKIEKPITILINDGAQNRIKQLKDIELTKGVYTGKFQLSEQPVLGNWLLEVIVEGESPETKSFEVAKYVLPKFDVTIETAKDVAIPDGVIKVTVRSKYTYGKGVKGKATVSIKPTYHYYGSDDDNLKAEKTIDVDGKGHVEFDMTKDLRLSTERSYVPPLKILAVMEEELTGNKQNTTATVNLHVERYKISGVDTPYNYHPGKPVIFKVVVKNLDGSPVQDTKNPVKLIVEPPRNYFYRGIDRNIDQNSEKPDEKIMEFVAKLNEHGMATFEFTLPEANSSFYSVKCQYQDTTAYLSSLSKFSPTIETPELLKVIVNTEKPALGKDVSVEIKSSEVLPYFVYTIVARGNILKSEHVDVPEGRKSHTIKFTPTFEMIPNAKIYVHYVFDNNLRFEEKTISFEKDFENSIDITTQAQAKPGEDVKLQIKTDPESFVGLLGVDQSVLLLKSGNDFNKDQILNSLNNFDTNTPWMRGYGRYPGQMSGLVTMTNANYPYNDGYSRRMLHQHFMRGPAVLNGDYPYYNRIAYSSPPQLLGGSAQMYQHYQIMPLYSIGAPLAFASFGAPGVGVMSQSPSVSSSFAGLGAGGGGGGLVEPPQIRKEFPEGWLFQNVEKPVSSNSGSIPIMGASGHRGHSATTSRPFISTTVEPTTAEEAAVNIRQDFTDLWIFNDINDILTDADGFTLAKKIPDTITSWVITGFSLNPKTGFALTENPTKIQVFQPFFVSTNLPYSVKRGEVIAIPVIIFNYMDKTLDAEITMDNADQEYEFTEATNEVDENPSDEVKRIKRVTIPSNTGKSVSFMIRPKKVGETTLKITAVTPLAGDAIHQKLKVEPEGVTQYENRAIFVNLKDKPEYSEKITVDVPAEAVPESEYIEFSVVGDLLGPTIKNLDKLVRMPYGCGEQNMVNFVPNILVLKYLEAINQNMPAIVEKAKKFLDIGYQRELTYKHDDGSYSAFGKSDNAGSTWLTAYVVRSFHQASKYTDIDPKIIIEGLDFLASKQTENGSFPEYGKLFDSAHQNELGLNAFVLLAFLENVEHLPKYQANVDKSMQFLLEKVDSSDDQYSLAIAASALQMAKNPKADKVLAKLESVAKQENDRKWWSKEPEVKSEEPAWYHRPRSNDVEITSYVLLALLEKESAERALPVIKWLISQRNSNGGFASTQDTVVGLQALIKFAEKTGSGTGEMEIDFVSTGGTENKGNIKVNPDNSLVLQTHVLPKTTRQVDFTAKGKGSSMVQLSYRYNLAEKDKKPSFQVKTSVKDNTPPQQLIVEVCAEYVPLEDDKKKESNMAVLEVALPSGYTAEADSFGNIESIDRVKRTETKNSDSTVIIYFDSLTAGDVKCVPIEASKTHAVAKQKPAAVTIYDYYDTGRRATEYYQVKSSLCDICEGTDCGAGCKKE